MPRPAVFFHFTCEQCHKPFSLIRHKASQRSGRFCSRTCLGKWRYPPTMERFNARLQPDPSGCILWTGGKTTAGYGILLESGTKKHLYTHRFAYEIHIGPIPPGIEVLHKCDRPACCNPEHLFLGTQTDNIADMTSKGRQATFKLTPEKVREIRSRFAAGGVRRYELAREFGVSGTLVGKIISRKLWVHI